MGKKKSTQAKVQSKTIEQIDDETKDWIVGYKVFDEQWQCSNHFQYEVGKTYEMPKEQVKLCQSGFHFCLKCADCFQYYDFKITNKIALVKVESVVQSDETKSVTNHIKIIKEITWEEMLKLCNLGQGNSGLSNSGHYNSGNRNSGHRNSGDYNSGHYNSGHRNSGHYNSGDYNSGDYNSGHRNSGNCNSGDYNSGHRNSGNRNSGDYNSGNCNSGHFNTVTPPEILVFNKICKRLDWDNALKPSFFYDLDLTKWIQKEQMSTQELQDHPEQKTLNGYLKTTPYKLAWAEVWKTASDEDKRRLKALPNFDAIIFEEITGIKVDKMRKANYTYHIELNTDGKWQLIQTEKNGLFVNDSEVKTFDRFTDMLHTLGVLEVENGVEK